MRTSEPLAKPGVASPESANRRPAPFTPEPEEVPGALPAAPIEPPPPAAQRTLKGKLHHCGRSRPIPIVDPWE